jgi:hypothetical protein
MNELVWKDTGLEKALIFGQINLLRTLFKAVKRCGPLGLDELHIFLKTYDKYEWAKDLIDHIECE